MCLSNPSPPPPTEIPPPHSSLCPSLSMSSSMARRPTDEAILSFEQEIRNDIAQNTPLVSDLFPITCLSLEYENNFSYHNIIQKFICPRYESYRKCRGDGNCFYRAFSFGLIEQQLLIPDADKMINDINKLLLSVGFDKFAYDDFLEEFIKSLDKRNNNSSSNGDYDGNNNGSSKDKDKDHQIQNYEHQHDNKSSKSIGDYIQHVWMAEEHKSHALVVLMRLICSAYLRSHEEEFAPFITEEKDIKVFCQKHVECLGQDADQVQIISLAKALGVRVQIAYLVNNEEFLNGGSQNGDSDCILEFGLEQSPIVIHLLYRPGHYDLLYK